MQLIRERIRMEELEFLFKHALAQEAVYQSILHKIRKERHLDVARAIEEIFVDRLPDFFGVLAYHYSQGEDLDKAEEYLEKAGSAALESAASSEALVFFQQALTIYKSKVLNEVSSKKLIILEKNIARAFHNKGLYVEAIKHYDATLEYLGRKKKGKIANIIEAVSGFLTVLTYFYLPFTRSKKEPDESALEIIQILYDKAWALCLVDATEFFITALIAMRHALKVNPQKVPLGPEILCTIGIVFSGTGIPFKIVEKILDTIESELHEEGDLYIFLDAEQVLNFFSGIRSCSYNDKAVDFFVKKGDFSRVNIYLAFWAIRFIYRGQFLKSLEIAEKQKEIAVAYDNESSLVVYYETLAQQYYLQNKTTEGLMAVNKLIELSTRIGQQALIKLYASYKLNLLLQAGRFEEAGEVYNHIKRLIQEETILMPLQVVPPLMSMTVYLLNSYERSESPEKRKALLREMKPVVRKMQRYGKKFASRYAGVCRLTGVYYLYAGTQRIALKWWKEGLRIAVKLDLKPDIGRIYYEISKCLHEPDSKFKKFENLSSDHYLQKAQEILSEIGMEWTLEASSALV